MIRRAYAWFFGKASLRRKLIVSFSLLVSIPIIVLGAYSFSQSFINIETQTLGAMDASLSRLVSELDTRVQREIDDMKFLAYNLSFRNALELAQKDPVSLAREMNTTVESVFWYFLTSDTYLKAIEVFSSYIEQPSVGPFLRSDLSVRDTDWYLRREHDFRAVWSFEDGRLYAVRTVLDTATSSRMIGVMRFEFFPDSLFDPINNMSYMGNGVLLTDGNGQILYRKHSSNAAQDMLVDQMIKGEIREQSSMYLCTSQLATVDWRVYYYLDRAEPVRQLAPIVRSTLMMTGLCIVVAYLLIGVLSKTLSRRILMLKAAAERVAAGDFGTQAPTSDTDEVGVVTNSFVSMANQLREMIDRVYKMDIEKKTAELQALQAMINPHFLYNCLSSVKWKALYSGQEEIADTVGLIAKFYRTSLNSGRQLTTVRNELENVKSYVEIQRSMHGNSFDARYEIDEGALDAPILNFLLQPIVENAIVHGINLIEGEEKGLLIVRFRAENGSLIFDIVNNGEPVDLTHLNSVLLIEGKGYGLYNIQRRIEFYYGKGCGLSVSLSQEGYTCVTVRLKKED